jgi:hypothetical protein
MLTFSCVLIWCTLKYNKNSQLLFIDFRVVV